MDNKWEELYDAAKQVLKPRDVSKIIEVGGVAAAVESISGKIYVGVCVDTACTLGVCAERNAIFNMITNGEDAIKRVIAIDGEPVLTTSMIVTPAAVNEYFNVHSTVFVEVPRCCCSRISVRNTTATSINVANANLIVERVA